MWHQHKSLISIFLWVLLHHKIHAETQKISFLGQSLTRREWDDFQKRIDCATGSGDWEALELPLFHTNCWTPFSWWQNCVSSNLSKKKFDWKPKDCPLDPSIEQFTARDVCEIMKGRNFMVVGDSMSTEFSTSLKNRMYEGVEQATVKCTQCYHICEHNFTMPCQEFVGAEYLNFTHFDYRNDRLSLTDVKIHDYKTLFLENPWFKKVGEGNIDVLLLNRGAHYALTDILLKEINETLTAVRHTYPDVTIIWRNTPRGHTEEERKNFLGPPLSKNYTAPLDLPWNWGDIQGQNPAVRDLIVNHFPGILFMDVVTSTVLRSDAHFDGYHYCVPGPLDTWVNFFLYAMNVANSLSANKN